MNKIINKMTLSMLTALLILLTFGASTFAWISMITTVRAEGMQFEVSTPATLLISKNGEPGTFVDSITYVNDRVENIYPVSSKDGSNGSFFAIDDLEAINDLGRILENRTQIVTPAEVTYTAEGEIFEGSTPYYQRDFYLQLTASEYKTDIRVKELKLEYPANDDDQVNGVTTFRFAVLVLETLKDDNGQPILDDEQNEVKGWVSHGVKAMKDLTDSDKAYTETSKPGYSVIANALEIGENDTTHLDADDQPFAAGTVVVPTTVTVIVHNDQTDEDEEQEKACYRALAASEYQVIDPVEDQETHELTNNKYYDYEAQAEVEVASKTFITKDPTGTVYITDSIKRLADNDLILTVEAGETETVHVMVRMWLDGEDENTNNKYFARLTGEYVFSISFKLERNND